MSLAVSTTRGSFEALRGTIRTGDMMFSCHESSRRFLGLKVPGAGELIHVGQGFRRPWHAMMLAHIDGVLCITESTASFSEDGTRGVQFTPVEKRLPQINGPYWLSLLSDDLRYYLDEAAMLAWILTQKGRKYSFANAGWAGLDTYIKILPEEFGRSGIMCSRFNMAAIRKGIREDRPSGYVITREASPTPAQLARMPGIFRQHYQLAGKTLHQIGCTA
jgi:hypothetical protein